MNSLNIWTKYVLLCLERLRLGVYLILKCTVFIGPPCIVGRSESRQPFEAATMSATCLMCCRRRQLPPSWCIASDRPNRTAGCRLFFYEKFHQACCVHGISLTRLGHAVTHYRQKPDVSPRDDLISDVGRPSFNRAIVMVTLKRVVA